MYLFLAIPNFCGSTLMHSLLETVPEVVPLVSPRDFLGKRDFVEGNVCALGGYKNLNGPHSMEANMEHVYADPSNYDWDWVKKCWHENWANSNPYGTIRMQKTPADIFRIQMMQPYFPGCKWIVSVRNPYAYVESIMRKATFQMEPLRQLDQVCFHALRTLEIQISNIALLGDQCYWMTYEDFIARPEHHRQQLANWIPELSQIDFNAHLIVKGKKVEGITDDSEFKWERLIQSIPDITGRINTYFSPHEKLLRCWGYHLKTS